MANRNKGNGRLPHSSGLDQLGPKHSTGGGYWKKGSREAAQKRKRISARVNMSAGQRSSRPITLPSIGASKPTEGESR
jgi:hypothetical protein